MSHITAKDSETQCKLYIDWAQHFEAKSQSWHPREEEDMPRHIESIFNECEYSPDIIPVLRRASKAEAGWLARFTQDRVEKERKMLDWKSSASCSPRILRAKCAASASC